MSKFTGLLFLLTSIYASGQVSDFISVQKKNGRIIKNFFSGSPVLLQSTDGNMIEGQVRIIKNDSLFINVFKIETFYTTLGYHTFDTVATYVIGLNYKDILRIKLPRNSRFLRTRVGPLLMIGGAGYFLLNVINGDYLNVPFNDHKNLITLGASALAFGAGFVIQKFFPVTSFSRPGNKIVYVKLR